LNKYHAFISYRQATESDVAEKLEKALQQYAKPWHKLRAMNIYRDNDDQNLSPNLKKAVEDAMDGSEYGFLKNCNTGWTTTRWSAC
jgi:flagellar biosynthesis chaperone FliJ